VAICSAARGSYPSGYGNPSLRFWRKVNKSGPAHPAYGPCWVWTGGRFKSGYGVIYVGGKNVKVHRYSYILAVGDPGALNVLHKCDTPLCVNPAHLFLGDHADNVRDMVSKCRHPRGETHGKATVTDDVVREIRRLYKGRSVTTGIYPLALRYGVSPGTISGIVQRRTWKHIM
jgi:hypothetical protein